MEIITQLVLYQIILKSRTNCTEITLSLSSNVTRDFNNETNFLHK